MPAFSLLLAWTEARVHTFIRCVPPFLITNCIIGHDVRPEGLPALSVTVLVSRIQSDQEQACIRQSTRRSIARRMSGNNPEYISVIQAIVGVGGIRQKSVEYGSGQEVA
ncbi:hypothetical protein F4861DRAFT_110948 [Xylaria intraflava]|nr:hypothetical protein F4861DRAFT_110948 [Xylaria intraflava]